MFHVMIDTVGTGLQGAEGPDGGEFPLTPRGLKHLVLVQPLCIMAILCPVYVCIAARYWHK